MLLFIHRANLRVEEKRHRTKDIDSGTKKSGATAARINFIQ
jgi:hypothetical protein